ncbi:hypothetical protein [Shewanella ulleungensis]|jgi:hypothetical protein|uniref:Uncharacterized protein n=1 Tax=Shewanella ulleungensis TaxID=2282699 RepID=A0ABQ2QP51_9GAMM|nr:hypothetical protein [Shewanella ulleungensis]MCL1150046.1 hypothetical protein [Shewanella ulleungensis]GGP86363.1 hypothetical protein GCM10009410_19730 [Shewanella ulleungensis]
MQFKILPLLILASFATIAAPLSYNGTAHVIEGQATITKANLFTCQHGQSRSSPIGVKTENGQKFSVPASLQYQPQYFTTDLYNECSGVIPASIAEVDLSAVPVIEVDKDGEVVTGYIFADNYFELFINGKLIGVDPIPFTPFNSNIVRFKVKKPYDIAIKVVDWEENSGLGTENNRGKQYHPGDGGLIASFSDGTTTNAEWSAQTFYTAPIYDLSCATEVGQQRLTKSCNAEGRNSYGKAYSLHWQIPQDWQTNNQYISWPKSVEFTEQEIGVDNKKAYMNFQPLFSGAGASFIWSSNVILDNLVLFRYHVK